MTRYEVRFAASADTDFDSIQDYIARENPIRAITFVQELRDKSFRLLSEAPNAGAAIGLRRYIVHGRYVVIYTVDETRRVVTVTLVTEGHRDWRRMLEDTD